MEKKKEVFNGGWYTGWGLWCWLLKKIQNYLKLNWTFHSYSISQFFTRLLVRFNGKAYVLAICCNINLQLTSLLHLRVMQKALQRTFFFLFFLLFFPVPVFEWLEKNFKSMLHLLLPWTRVTRIGLVSLDTLEKI